MVTYADWVRSTREKKGQTQIQAAEALKLSGPTLSRWESGGMPDVRHLLRVVRWGRIKPDRLLKILAQPN
jgi:transcriptional regulator with XRE-family HTH domain